MAINKRTSNSCYPGTSKAEATLTINRDLSTTTVKRLVKSAAKAAGLDPEEIDAFSGHSLRVGAAQDLLCKGYDAAAIMRAGGWKSVNILGRYLELAEHNVWT